MVRYRWNGPEMSFTAQTTGGGTVDIANSGVTLITSTAAERYVLAPPVPGCQKTLVFMPSNTTTITVELSSVSSGDTITLLHSTGVATAVEITPASTVGATRVDLLGVTTAQWLVTGMYNNTTAAGIVFAAS